MKQTIFDIIRDDLKVGYVDFGGPDEQKRKFFTLVVTEDNSVELCRVDFVAGKEVSWKVASIEADVWKHISSFIFRFCHHFMKDHGFSAKLQQETQTVYRLHEYLGRQLMVVFLALDEQSTPRKYYYTEETALDIVYKWQTMRSEDLLFLSYRLEDTSMKHDWIWAIRVLLGGMFQKV